jgi:hypothetical protein
MKLKTETNPNCGVIGFTVEDDQDRAYVSFCARFRSGLIVLASPPTCSAWSGILSASNIPNVDVHFPRASTPASLAAESSCLLSTSRPISRVPPPSEYLVLAFQSRCIPRVTIIHPRSECHYLNRRLVGVSGSALAPPFSFAIHSEAANPTLEIFASI